MVNLLLRSERSFVPFMENELFVSLKLRPACFNIYLIPEHIKRAV